MHPAAPRTIIGSVIAITASLFIATQSLADEWIFQHAAPLTRQINTELRPMPAGEREPLIVLLALDPAQQLLLDDLDAARLRDMHDAWLPFVEWDRITNFAAGQGLVEGTRYRAERLERLKPVEAAAERAEAAMFEDLQLILSDDQRSRWLVAERWRKVRQIVQWSPNAGIAISDLVLAYMDAKHEPGQDRPEALHAIGQSLPMEILDQWITDLEAAQRRLGSVADSFSRPYEEFVEVISAGGFDEQEEMRPQLARVALRAIPIYEQAASRTIEHADRLAEALDAPGRDRFLRRIEQDKSTTEATRPRPSLPPSPTLTMIERIEHLTASQLIERPLPFQYHPIHDLVRARWNPPTTNAFDNITAEQRETIQTIANNLLARITPLRESLAAANQSNPQQSSIRVLVGDRIISLQHAASQPYNPLRPTRTTSPEKQAIQRQLAEIEIQTVEQLREALTIEQRIEILLLQ